MNVATLKTAIYTLLQPILGGTLVWADQNAPRPPLPFATLRLSVIQRIGTPHYSNPDNAGLQDVLAVRESVLQVQRFGPDSVGALETFADKLALQTNLDKFSLQKISLFDVSSVTDVAQLLNGLATEPRASVDLSLRWVSDQSDNVGLIDDVNVNGDLGPGNTAKNQIYTVVVS